MCVRRAPLSTRPSQLGTRTRSTINGRMTFEARTSMTGGADGDAGKTFSTDVTLSTRSVTVKTTLPKFNAHGGIILTVPYEERNYELDMRGPLSVDLYGFHSVERDTKTYGGYKNEILRVSEAQLETCARQVTVDAVGILNHLITSFPTRTEYVIKYILEKKSAFTYDEKLRRAVYTAVRDCKLVPSYPIKQHFDTKDLLVYKYSRDEDGPIKYKDEYDFDIGCKTKVHCRIGLDESHDFKITFKYEGLSMRIQNSDERNVMADICNAFHTFDRWLRDSEFDVEFGSRKSFTPSNKHACISHFVMCILRTISAIIRIIPFDRFNIAQLFIRGDMRSSFPEDFSYMIMYYACKFIQETKTLPIGRLFQELTEFDDPTYDDSSPATAPSKAIATKVTFMGKESQT